MHLWAQIVCVISLDGHIDGHAWGIVDRGCIGGVRLSNGSFDQRGGDWQQQTREHHLEGKGREAMEYWEMISVSQRDHLVFVRSARRLGRLASGRHHRSPRSLRLWKSGGVEEEWRSRSQMGSALSRSEHGVDMVIDH